MKESSLELLLAERSQTFRDKVRALVQRYNIDENDPTFILLIGTTTLEVLLETYPKEFEGLFEQLLTRMDKRWHKLQKKWALAAIKSSTAAEQVTQVLTEIKQASAAEQQTIRTQTEAQATLLTTVFQEQSQQLAAEAEQLAATALTQAQITASKQVEGISKKLRKAHYMEAAGFACVSASVMFFSGWVFGWFGHSTKASNSVWADLQRWNQQELNACVAAEQTTCNFQIEVPKE